MISGDLRPMELGDLELVRTWRNHPDVRRYMYTRHEIEAEEHRTWFDRAQNDERVSLLIYEIDGIPTGFVSFTATRSPDIADWGFYLAPNSEPRTGRGLGFAALRYAFEVKRLHKVCGQALGFNERSIRFHQALGFVQEGVLREHFFDGTHYQDIVCFGLIASEWQGS